MLIIIYIFKCKLFPCWIICHRSLWYYISNLIISNFFINNAIDSPCLNDQLHHKLDQHETRTNQHKPTLTSMENSFKWFNDQSLSSQHKKNDFYPPSMLCFNTKLPQCQWEYILPKHYMSIFPTTLFQHRIDPPFCACFPAAACELDHTLCCN